jgi:hypothetical protein
MQDFINDINVSKIDGKSININDDHDSTFSNGGKPLIPKENSKYVKKKPTKSN